MCFFIVRMPWLKAEDLFCCCWNKGFDLITGATSRLPMAVGVCGLVALRKSGWEEQSAAGASQGRHSQVSRANQPLSSTLRHDTKGKSHCWVSVSSSVWTDISRRPRSSECDLVSSCPDFSLFQLITFIKVMAQLSNSCPESVLHQCGGQSQQPASLIFHCV